MGCNDISFFFGGATRSNLSGAFHSFEQALDVLMEAIKKSGHEGDGGGGGFMIWMDVGCF